MARSIVGLCAGTLLALSLAGTVRPVVQVDAAASHTSNTAAVTPTTTAAHVRTLINIPQTWNNCGPTSVAEVLDFWGIERTQAQVQSILRADNNPRGMAPYGVPAYARSLGLRGLLGVGGTPALIKALISNGFPVIVSQWVSMSDRYGHYRPIEAYDDRQGVFTSSDPYLGPDHQIGYSDFTQMWQSTGQRFLVLYPPARQQLLNHVLASAGWNKRTAYQQDRARQMARLNRAAQPGTQSWIYNYAALAWDDVQLGDRSGAQSTLARAEAHGTSPVVLGWIRAELPAGR